MSTTKKGGGTLETQIAKLEERLNESDIKKARELANSSPDMIRLAFKLLDKPHRKSGLTKSQRAFFEQMHEINPEAAEEWKEQTLAAK